MYQQLIIAHPRLSDASAITASSEQGTMPVTNLIRSIYPSDAYRSLGNPGEVRITIHLPEEAGLSWDLVSLLYGNASGDGTWQIVAAPTEAGLAAPSLTDAVRPLWPVPDMMRPGSPPFRHALRWLKGNPRTEPWLQLILNDPNPVCDPDVIAPFLQFGRLYVALAWQPSYHHDKGSQFTPADEKARRSTNQSGGTRVGAGNRPRAFNFNVGFQTREEMLTRGYELDRLVGTSGDLLVIDAPEDPVHMDKLMICGLLTAAGVERHEETEIYSRSYTIAELL